MTYFYQHEQTPPDGLDHNSSRPARPPRPAAPEQQPPARPPRPPTPPKQEEFDFLNLGGEVPAPSAPGSAPPAPPSLQDEMQLLDIGGGGTNQSEGGMKKDLSNFDLLSGMAGNDAATPQNSECEASFWA